MAAKNITLLLFAALFYSAGVNGLVKLYDSLAFEGLFFQNTPNENCTNVPAYGRDVASSLRTDQCIMVFTGDNCGGSSVKITPGEYPDLKEITRPDLNLDNKIKSYRICTQGEALTVDFRTGYNNDESSSVIVTIPDICGCINLPLYAHGKVNSLNNRGNCVKLYSELECRGSSVEIPGGAGPETGNLTMVQFNGVTKSASGCGAAASCVRLIASIQNIAVKAVPVNILPVETVSIAMSSNITYENSGAASAEELYDVAKDVEEIVTINLNQGMRSMYRSSVSSSVAVESDIGIPVFSPHELSPLLSSAYTFSNGPGVIAAETSVTKRVKLFTANERVTIPACSSYTLTSFLKYARNYPADYEVVARITGLSGDRSLTAEQVKDALGDSLEYIEDFDENTIIVKGNGTITASFGIKAEIVGEGTKIPTCTLGTQSNMRKLSLVEEI